MNGTRKERKKARQKERKETGKIRPWEKGEAEGVSAKCRLEDLTLFFFNSSSSSCLPSLLQLLLQSFLRASTFMGDSFSLLGANSAERGKKPRE